jgi:hypothetical protein
MEMSEMSMGNVEEMNASRQDKWLDEHAYIQTYIHTYIHTLREEEEACGSNHQA